MLLIEKMSATLSSIRKYHYSTGDSFMSYAEALKLFKGSDFMGALEKLGPLIEEPCENVAVLTLAAQCTKLQGDLVRARSLFESCCDANPSAQAYYNLGSFYMEQGDRRNALTYYSKAYECDQGYLPGAEAYADMLITAGFLSEAEKISSAIMGEHPDVALGYMLEGRVMTQSGRSGDAVEVLAEACAIEPDNQNIYALSILAQNYRSTAYEAELVDSTIRWGQAIAVSSEQFVHCKNSSKGKIRVGYVSADFRRHSVAYFIEPILYSHDKNAFEVYGYSFTTNTDDVTLRMSEMCNCWRDVSSMTEKDVAQLIYDDQIDILIDLGGITYNGIKVFSGKPAPVQATFLGYPNTTGLSCIDYRFTDEICDPRPSHDNYTEELVELKSGFLTFAPPEESPEVSVPPFEKNGFTTFGSFNIFAKVTDETLDVWSKVLQRVPASKLLLKSKLFVDKTTCDDIIERFNQRGVCRDRLILRGWAETLTSHLDIYNEVDIALDTFPYNGTTTTCEALWMGVPVISLYGGVHRSRVGLSILSQVGLASFAVNNPRDYIKQAVRLAENNKGVAELRKSLREVLATSPVCDAVSTAREMEQCYRQWIDLR